MTEPGNRREACKEAEYFARVFKKLIEDAEEAYFRTPIHISSRPYIERIRRLAQAGLAEAELLLRKCSNSL